MRLLFWKGRTTPAKFRDRFRAALLERYPGATAVDEGELDLQITGVPAFTSATLNLTRGYAEFQRDPARFDDIFERCSASLATPKARHEFDLDAVVPMLKDRTWLAQVENGLLPDARGSAPFVVPLNAELCIAYAEFSRSIWFVTRDTVAAHALDPDGLHARALAALASRSGPRQIFGGDPVYLVGVGGNFEAATLLNEALWRDARLAVDGAPLIAVPDRDSLLIARDESPWSVWVLAAHARRLHGSEPYPISKSLFVRTGAGRYDVLDDGLDDDSHPIPRLDTIDVHAVLSGGGSTLVVVIASPLDDSPRSVLRLFRKIEGHLSYIDSDGYRAECGAPDPARTVIEVTLHRDSSPRIRQLLERIAPDCVARNASLTVREIGDA